MSRKLFEELDLFVFDMDGLLFDTETVYVNYGRELSEEKGYIITNEFVEKTTISFKIKLKISKSKWSKICGL